MEASPLAAVRLVLRQKLAIQAPDVVGVVITDFLIKDLTLCQACDLSHAGSTALLEFVWAKGLWAMESERWSVGKMLHTQPHYARWAFTRAMVGAVNRGDLAMVQWLRGRFPDCPIYEEVLGEACKSGRLEALQLLHSVKNGRDFQWSGLMPDSVAFSGHWDVIRWVHEQCPNLPLGCALKYALKQNNLKEIKWITALFDDIGVGETYVPYSEETWSARKDCVRYLVARDLAVDTIIKGAIQTAAEANDLGFVQWLTSHQLPQPESVYKLALKRACEHGHIQVLRCLLTRMEELGLPSSPSALLCAASKSGQLAMVQWIYELHGRNAEAELFAVKRGLTALEAAAENGHLEVVQFLHRIDEALRIKRKKQAVLVSRPTCATNAMDGAAGAGHLDVVKWLHANRSEGCSIHAMGRAAARGHLDVVKWLHSNRLEGCTKTAMVGVAGRVYHEPGCPGSLRFCCADKSPDSFVEAQIAMLEWFKMNRKEGCTSEAIDRASLNGNLAVLHWLRANTMVRPSSPYPIQTAASNDRLDIIKWLHKTFPECCMDVAMVSAAKSGHFQVVKWLDANLPGNNPGNALIAAAGYVRFSPTRRQLDVVQHLLSNCAPVDIASAMVEAMREAHFEIVLLLHTQHPTLTSDDFESLRYESSYFEDPSDSNYELSEWIKENYAVDSESE